MKLSETAEIYTMLAAFAPDRTDVDERSAIAIWHSAIGDLPADVMHGAVHAWFRSHKWFPFPAELRELAVRSLAGLPSPQDAWLDAQRLARERTVFRWDAGHPAVVDALRDIGGARAVNESTALHHTRRDFLDAYAARVMAFVAKDGDELLALSQQRMMEALADGR